MYEDVSATDRRLHYGVPDKKLQRRALPWVVVAFIVSLTCTCVVAIATGAVPSALVITDAVLALAVFGVAGYIFPKR